MGRDFKTSEAKRKWQREYRALKAQDPKWLEKQARYFKRWRRENKTDLQKKDRQYQRQNSVKIRLRKKGLDAGHRELVERHSGLCDICRGPGDGRWKTLVIDHCHQSLRFRGMLCSLCNRGLGFFRDDPALMARAIRYLKRKP